MKIERELHYDDIYLVPQKSILKTRSEADISMTLGSHTFCMPVMPANMKSVVDESTCEYLARKNIFYVMHRICSEAQIMDFVFRMNAKKLITSISIGIKEEHMYMLKQLKEQKAIIDYITIDIAHAHNDETLNVIDKVKRYYPDTFLIVGNIATGEAVEFFNRHGGADATRVGIAGGASCITKNMTGFHRRMVSCLIECNDASRTWGQKPIIADGGIRENGDYAKALNCGKNIIGVMAGSMFAGYEESAGDILVIDDKKYKEYYGNASEKAKGNKIHVEGKTVLIPFKGSMDHYLEELKMSLASSVSYGGVSKISDFYGIPIITF